MQRIFLLPMNKINVGDLEHSVGLDLVYAPVLRHSLPNELQGQATEAWISSASQAYQSSSSSSSSLSNLDHRNHHHCRHHRHHSSHSHRYRSGSPSSQTGTIKLEISPEEGLLPASALMGERKLWWQVESFPLFALWNCYRISFLSIKLSLYVSGIWSLLEDWNPFSCSRSCNSPFLLSFHSCESLACICTFQSVIYMFSCLCMYNHLPGHILVSLSDPRFPLFSSILPFKSYLIPLSQAPTFFQNYLFSYLPASPLVTVSISRTRRTHHLSWPIHWTLYKYYCFLTTFICLVSLSLLCKALDFCGYCTIFLVSGPLGVRRTHPSDPIGRK